MNGIMSKGWSLPVVLAIGILLLIGIIAFRRRKHGRSKKPISLPLGPSPAELRSQRAALEDKRKQVLARYQQRQKEEQAAFAQLNRLNEIKNTFLRDFGLVERMEELQKCLSMARYNGRPDANDANLIYTQLSNMARMIQQLDARQGEPLQTTSLELHIPGWLAMTETEKRLGQASPSEQPELAKLYRSQMKAVEQALDDQLAQWQATVALQTPDPEEMRLWEARLNEVKKLLGDPEAADEKRRAEVARDLAEYAAKVFKHPL